MRIDAVLALAVCCPLPAQTPPSSLRVWGELVADTALADATDIADLAAGLDVSLLVRTNGTVVGFGGNRNGACQPPGLPPGLAYLRASCGMFHVAALRSDGRITVWGTTDSQLLNVPPLPGGVTYIQVDAGLTHNLALRSDGMVAAWGGNASGERNVPVLPAGMRYLQVEAVGSPFGGPNGLGGGTSLALRSDGNIVAWGDNTVGLLTVPPLAPGVTYTAISAFDGHAAALRSDGTAITWWAGSVQAAPALPPGLTYVAVAAGSGHTLALRSDGTVVGWGSNQLGQINVPQLPPGVTYTHIAAGRAHSLARRSDGSFAAWGHATSWQTGVPGPGAARFQAMALGAASITARRDDDGVQVWGDLAPPPPPLPAGVTWRQIVAAEYVQVGLRSDGQVEVWGDTRFGLPNVPPLPTGLVYTLISAGGFSGAAHCLALRSDGALVGWGHNLFGETNVPALPPGTTYVAAAAGAYHSIALRSDGQLAGWGYNLGGQATVPPPTPGLPFVDVFAGETFSLALRADGSMIGWGDFTMSNVPPMPPGMAWVDVACGYRHAVARRSDGAVVAWGQSFQGQDRVPPLPAGLGYIGVGAAAYLSGGLVGSPSRYTFLAAGCAGSRPVARLVPRTTPRTGETFEVRVLDVPGVGAWMLTGWNTTTPFGALPVALGTLGMGNCTGHVAPDQVTFLLASSGVATMRLAIPRAPWLLGFTFAQQAFLPDPGAGNALGAVMSDAAQAVLGG